MGGNVVMLYAGVRPDRIRRLINLEGFGMPATRPPRRRGAMRNGWTRSRRCTAAKWTLKPYDDAAGVARRLMKTNRRLSQDKADWLARHWAAPNAQGQWVILGEPAHKIVNANLYQVDETLALYARITAPTLSVVASDCQLEQWWQGRYGLAEYHERLKSVPNLHHALARRTPAHMLHHDQPAQLASLIEGFCA
jgi:pimeloyl-ACP methyl ester carboxylesterase